MRTRQTALDCAAATSASAPNFTSYMYMYYTYTYYLYFIMYFMLMSSKYLYTHEYTLYSRVVVVLYTHHF